jgi:hypothetical protein
MTTCAIMQPTYLPWSGYFSLIDGVDRFVLLDDVQFERRSWQSRNRILMNGDICTLTVPVRKTARATAIGDIELSGNEDWQAAHWKTLRIAYAKAPHGSALLGLLEPVYLEARFSRLAELNQQLIESFCRALNIDTPLVRASSLGCGGARSQHLFAICSELGCSGYVSPRGSADYLAADEFAAMGSLRLSFQEFTPRPYAQLRVAEFVSHLSIVDVIANIGVAGAGNYIRGTDIG